MAKAVKSKTDDFIKDCLVLASDMIKFSSKQIWIDYDEGADVLYMSFRKPQRASKTIEISEDILLRKNGEDIVGITIMNASYQEVK